MSEKKKRGNRREYLNDFKMNSAGSYEYSGRMMGYDTPAAPRAKALAALWVLCGGMLVLAFASGCLQASGIDHCAYVLLPYAAEVVLGGTVCWALGRLTLAGDPIREYVYKQTAEKLPRRMAAAMIFCGITLGGEALYLILNGAGEKTLGTIIFIIMQCICLAVLVFARKIMLGLRWTKQ